MSSVELIFPHQLFERRGHRQEKVVHYVVEEVLFFRQYQFHKQKIAFHRATMRWYADQLQQDGCTVEYVPSSDRRSDIRKLIPTLAGTGINHLRFSDPTDNWLGNRIERAAANAGIQLTCTESPLFLNTTEDLRSFFRHGKKKFHQTEFYTQQRKKRQLLLDDDGRPNGGKSEGWQGKEAEGQEVQSE